MKSSFTEMQRQCGRDAETPCIAAAFETSAQVGAAGRLALGGLSVRVDPDPLTIHIEREGRSLLAGLELWAADGTVHDHFMQMTEGVIAREELGRPLRVARSRGGERERALARARRRPVGRESGPRRVGVCTATGSRSS